VREAAADEIYVKDPVLMVVEPESLCWLSGRKSDKVDGDFNQWYDDVHMKPVA